MTRSHRTVPTLATVLSITAAPAIAQEYCGGFGNEGVWIGGDEASSDIATADGFREQMALVLGGNDYVSLFNLSQPTDVRVEAAGRGSGDPVIDLLDQNGGIILSDDDSGGNAASRAETFLQPGTYCMAMRSYDGGPMTAFVRVGRLEQEALTMGLDTGTTSLGTCAEAVAFGPLGSSMTSTVNETPYYSFTLDQPTAVSITAENENADPVIALYGPGDSFLAENDDFDGLNSRLDMSSPLDPGTYCLEMSALSDDSAPVTVTISAYDAEQALLAIYDRGEAAPPLDGSFPVTDLGVLQSRLREDVQATEDVTWFSVDIEEPGLLLVEAIGSAGSDPWLVVFDDLGREVGQNDDYGTGLDSLVTARVQAGTYIVGVRHFGSNQGLIRLLAERYIPAR